MKPTLLFTGMSLGWVALVAVTPVHGEAVEIVQTGRPAACIVLPENPHALEREAAEDLRWAVLEATGAEMEILTGKAAPEGRMSIRIGQAADAANPSMPDDLPYDGAVIRADGKAIDILASSPAGTTNGVATVLLEDIGVRTYYPDALFTFVPEAQRLSITPRVVRPSFDYRIWSGLVGRDAAAYRRRNRITDHRVPIPKYGFGHNLANIIPVPKYAKEHPEYFAYRQGGRWITGTNVADSSQPCFTHPEVLRLTIEAARTFFDEHPERDTFSLCGNDNHYFCECESCAALDEPYRDLPVGRQHSESYYRYVSQVAEAIAESHPGRYIGVYAYWSVEQPPRDRQKLPPNVIVALTLDILQHYDPAYREKDEALVRAWSGHAERLHSYVYYGLGWYTPRMSPRLVAENLRFSHANGIKAIYCEAYPFWAWGGPMLYVAARLQWDVEADVETMLREFHNDCFGEAAAEMRAFHHTCERYWTQPRAGRWFEGLDNLGPEATMADTSILREAEAHLEAAARRANTEDDRRRVAWIREGFAFPLAIADAFDAARATGPARDRLARLITAIGRVDTAHQVLVKDPAYGHTYYRPGKRFDLKCWRWMKAQLQSAAKACHEELTATLPENERDERWRIFARESGLADLLAERGWEPEWNPPVAP